MQYYALPFTTADLAKSLHVSQARIQEANTTSMLSRSIGAVIFGIASDQYGRKWPLMIDLVLLAAFSVSSGFVHNYGQLVGVRFLFGELTPHPLRPSGSDMCLQVLPTVALMA